MAENNPHIPVRGITSLSKVNIVPEGIDHLQLMTKSGAVTLHLPHPQRPVPAPQDAAGGKGDPPPPPKPTVPLPPIFVPQLARQDMDETGLAAKTSVFVARHEEDINKLALSLKSAADTAEDHQQLVVPVFQDVPIDLDKWHEIAKALPEKTNIHLIVKRRDEQ